ncbi:MAG TPA: hypothetical protein VG273_27655 [Bryobacteraceae bacterium]|jgi:hypothetical protein|nr:hypothetical protein [Bryobacteraceae bacterium]
MKSFLLASATLVLSASVAFGAGLCNPDAFRPDGRMSCLAVEAGAVKASMDYTIAQESAKIDAARKRYWALSPNSPGFDKALKDYSDALREKDVYYLAMSTSLTLNTVFVKAGNALAALSGDTSVNDLNKIPDNMDGGLRPYARPLFARWVAALRRREEKRPPTGDPLADAGLPLIQFAAKMLNDPSANPLLLVDALQDRSHFRDAYEHARNWAELLASGVDISKMDPEIYICSQMEADVSWTQGLDKPDDLPEPVEATHELYKLFVKMFGEPQVRAAASATLHAPKNSVGGLATRSPVEIGEFVASPSPNPYYLFLSQVTKSSPRAYAIALAFDPNTLLTMQPAAAFNMKDNWQKANSVYTQLVAKYGEANVLSAARRLKDTPKDSEGRIAGDTQSQPLRVWFQALLKDSNAVIPDGQVAHFRAGSYDPRWMGKVVQVRGTVSGVVLDTSGLPLYATIHFKESKNDRFTVFTPNSEILQNYGQNFSGLVGKPIEILGEVRDWREGAGIRFLTARELKVLDEGALANFRESAPDWMKVPLPAENLVDSPRYLAWKKFPAGTKAGYRHDLLREYKPGTNQYTRTTISRFTFKLESIDDEQAVVMLESTVSGKTAGRNGPDTSSVDRQILKAKQAPPRAPVKDPRRIVASGEEVLLINGRRIPTRWESSTQADDPLTFTKTWTSDEVPGGLVRTQEQTHTEITDETYRIISQTLYAPIEGVEPQLGDVATPAPPAAASPARPPAPPAAQAPPPPPPARPASSTTSSGGQPEFMTHYGAVMNRAARARSGLAQAKRKSSIDGSPLPDDVRAAEVRLTSQIQTMNLVFRTRDYAAGEQSLRAMEDTLAVIENFVAKAGGPSIRRDPRVR